MAKDEKTDIVETPEPEVEESQVEHKTKAGGSRLDRFKRWYVDHKLWSIPASVLIVLLILAAVPFTRYGVAGAIVKKDLTVKVLDTTANTPVSGAIVSAGGVNVQTDGGGVAKIPKLRAGDHSLSISKKYYSGTHAKALVPIFGSKAGPQIRLTATGRQVKITITNRINKKLLSNVDIAVADIKAKTDKNGSATVVLPAGKNQQNASLSLDGYVDAKVSVKVSNSLVQQNSFNLTPSGKVYFLSKLSGKIDVVKTNLDGTDRKTVLAGTGNEDDLSTVLLASRDWKYLALLSKRAGSSDTLYLIDTSDDSLNTIDEGDASFNIVGWINDSFAYTVAINGLQPWQSKKTAVKVYNASTKSLKIVDQTDAVGDHSAYATENIGWIYSLNSDLVYMKTWSAKHSNFSSSYPELSGKQTQLVKVQMPDATQKVVKSWDISTTSNSLLTYDPLTVYNSAHYKTDEVYFALHAESNADLAYDEYDGAQVSENSKEAKEYFNSGQYDSTYLLSPSGNSTFWVEPRDGKNSLLVGDSDGSNGKEIASLSDYTNYGWYSDDYLLVSKNSSELYVVARNDGKSAVKISDYHKPALTYYGYGGGYGGL